MVVVIWMGMDMAERLTRWRIQLVCVCITKAWLYDKWHNLRFVIHVIQIWLVGYREVKQLYLSRLSAGEFSPLS